MRFKLLYFRSFSGPLASITLGFLALSLSFSAVAAASTSESSTARDIEDFLHADYYEIEFFVFERPPVMEFNTDESLALTAERALPLQMRSQPAAGELALWPYPMDPLTRACLTFPTLSYELLPLRDSMLDNTGAELIDNQSSEVQAAADDPPGIDPAGLARVPMPVIEPRLEPDPLLDLMAAMASFERDLAASSRIWQTSDRFLLGAQARRVERRGIGRLLFHGRWMQAVLPRESADPIFIEGGLALQQPVPRKELTGTVEVTLGRYLHFRADLYFHAPGLGLAPGSAYLQTDGSYLLDAPLESTLHSAERYMELSESRRMRSTETHYLDHPKLGLVVRIDPVQIPTELVEAFDSLEEDAE